MKSGSSLRETSPLVHALMMLFGFRAWTDLAGLWVELPLFVERLPEGWTLASYLSVILQSANVVLILYVILNLLVPNVFTDTLAIKMIYLIGGVAILLVAFFWDRTSIIDGTEYSIALMVLTFLMGGIACMTSVVFVTFLSGFDQSYLTSNFLGQGLGQIVPSILALIQGIGNTDCRNVSISTAFVADHYVYNESSFSLKEVLLPPLFAPRYFFLIMFAFELVSAVSFLTLLYRFTPSVMQVSGENSVQQLDNYTPADTSVPDEPHLEIPIKQRTKTLLRLTLIEFITFLTMAFWVNFLWNGLLRSLQVYASLPYSKQVYHIAVTLCEAANPVACFLALFKPVRSKLAIFCITLLGTAVGSYAIVIASLSPYPPLVEEIIGQILAVGSQAMCVLFVTYVKVCVAGICHDESRRAGLWFGVVIQAAAFLGSVLVFLLVNVFGVFQSASAC